jgi:predicted MFS family arabinose efflux permease
MRLALVGETVPHNQLIGAAGIQRTTMESARIAGALTGAGLVTALGIGQAYVVVVLFYLVSIVLMAKSGPVWPRREDDDADTAAAVPIVRLSPWGSLKEGFVYAWNTPPLFAILLLAFLLNCTAFPLTNHLMPVVAKNIYQADQDTLGYMVAALSAGALTGSLLMSRFAYRVSAGRMMIVFNIGWFAMLTVFAHMPTAAMGIPALVLVGLTQSLGLVPGAAILLRQSDQRFHGRIMGMRMLAIYGNLPGLLLSGPLIASLGYPATATIYCAVGILFTVVIALRWRAVLWQADAPANAR